LELLLTTALFGGGRLVGGWRATGTSGLGGLEPCWRPTTPFSSGCEPLKAKNSLAQLGVLLSKFFQNFIDVHYSPFIKSSVPDLEQTVTFACIPNRYADLLRSRVAPLLFRNGNRQPNNSNIFNLKILHRWL
jgi:hypothetical protein